MQSNDENQRGEADRNKTSTANPPTESNETDGGASEGQAEGIGITDLVRKEPGVDVLINPLTKNGISFHRTAVDEDDTLVFDLFVAPGFKGKLFELYRRRPMQSQRITVTAGQLDGDVLHWEKGIEHEPDRAPVSLSVGKEMEVPKRGILAAYNGSEEEPVELTVSVDPAYDTEAFLRYGYALGLRLARTASPDPPE